MLLTSVLCSKIEVPRPCNRAISNVCDGNRNRKSHHPSRSAPGPQLILWLWTVLPSVSEHLCHRGPVASTIWWTRVCWSSNFSDIQGNVCNRHLELVFLGVFLGLLSNALCHQTICRKGTVAQGQEPEGWAPEEPFWDPWDPSRVSTAPPQLTQD